LGRANAYADGASDGVADGCSDKLANSVAIPKIDAYAADRHAYAYAYADTVTSAHGDANA
jgi:hypothetical protein